MGEMHKIAAVQTAQSQADRLLSGFRSEYKRESKAEVSA